MSECNKHNWVLTGLAVSAAATSSVDPATGDSSEVTL